MWFIIRTAICVGIVFSMTEGQSVIGDLEAAPTTLAAMAPAGMRDLVGGALSACKSDPKFCLEAAQRFAGQGGDPLVQLSKSGTASLHLVADTLTAADRTAPWRGNPKDARAAGKGREASRPAT
ncbi:hypothetical protein SAMN05519103_04526 [Rhizobiales bacterium GAS113]|jgi:hypothetical protein|nr:hypothetical protein SAMN05519103_04526 [Rhizobiales bacterium GAS113]SEE30550.1 hypothetical protein SAMN05519104_5728 [Rhizobiales bacterium GAS188]